MISPSLESSDSLPEICAAPNPELFLVRRLPAEKKRRCEWHLQEHVVRDDKYVALVGDKFLAPNSWNTSSPDSDLMSWLLDLVGLTGAGFTLDLVSWLAARDGGGVAGFEGVPFFFVADVAEADA